LNFRGSRPLKNLLDRLIGAAAGLFDQLGCRNCGFEFSGIGAPEKGWGIHGVILTFSLEKEARGQPVSDYRGSACRT
jgi:hypothetical protein